MKIHPIFTLLALMFMAVSGFAQVAGTIQATPKYTFKKVDLPSVSACVECIMTSAKRRYRAGTAILLDACEAGSPEKHYLKLNLVNGSDSYKIIISRDCLDEGFNLIEYSICSSEGADCGFYEQYSVTIYTDPPRFYCGRQLILAFSMQSTFFKVESLAPGWELFYEIVACEE